MKSNLELRFQYIVQESMGGNKHCKQSKRLPTVTNCDRECGDIVNRELSLYKKCVERGRYRVGPFVTPRPFGVQEERLIKFCMDETLNEGEIVFRTNFNEITRNDIMSMSPRSIINLKVVTAVAEMLSVEASINVRERKFTLFMPPYNSEHVGGEFSDISLAVGRFIRADLSAKNISYCEKIFVPVYCGHARWYMLVLVISEKRVEIWDPLRSAMTMDYNIGLCKRVLTSIDLTLDHGGANVDSTSIKFRDLSIEFWSIETTIRNEYDCALYFLKNINNALRLEYGRGLCIMGDGDNGIDYAVEEFLPKAAYRQCCLKIFTEMVKRFPTAPVEHLFWLASRSTSATSFNKYLDLIHNQSQECHDWLVQTDWSRWALYTIPTWVKCTCVTLSITDKLRNYLHQYLEMSIASRFVAIARVTAEMFERRRMEVWNWYREKVTLTVREVIKNRTIDGQRFVLVEDKCTRLKLIDTTSNFFDVNMEAKSCSCGLWQISGIPCAHACKGIQLIMGNVDEYVDNMMYVHNFCSMYAPRMLPFPEKHVWKWGASNKLLPPIIDSVNTISMKGSIESESSTGRQCIENNCDSAFGNPQWMPPTDLTHSAEQKHSLRMKSTSTDGSLSL